MKIKKLVEIICDELEWNYRILEHGDPSKDLVYYLEGAFHVRSNLSFSIFSFNDRENGKNKCNVQKLYNIGGSEFEVELYTAIDSILRNVCDCDQQELVEIVNACAKRVRAEIITNLDISEISDMETLIDTIKNHKLYSTLLFRVKRYKCIKEHQYRSYNSNPAKLVFGNRDYRRDIDVVDIEIYDDFTSLHYQNEGSRRYEEKTVNNSKSVENEILHAIRLWRDYYWS